MKEYKVKSPDGQIIRLMGPEGATPEQVIRMAKIKMSEKQQAPQVPIEGRRAADVQRAQRFQELSKQIKAEKSPFQRQAEEAGGFQAFGVGVAEGALNIGRGLGIADMPSELEQKAYGALQEEYPITTTVGEAAGETAPFMAVGGGVASIPRLGAGLAKSLIKRTALTGGLGAAESAIAARGKGASTAEQIGAGTVGGTIAGVTEAVMPKILRVGGKVIRKLAGRGTRGALVDAAGKPSQELTEALTQEGRRFEDLAAEEVELLKGYAGKEAGQAERSAFLQSQGFTENAAPTKAQIERTASAFMDQMEAAKRSGKVRGRLEEQNALLINKFDGALEDMGLDPQTTGNTVYDSVLNKATEMDNQIHDMYKMAEEVTGNQEVVKVENLVKSLDKYRHDDAPVVKALKGRMLDDGIIDADGQVLKNISVGEAEQMVQAINRRFAPGNPNANRIGAILKDNLDDSVTMSGGKELFRKARGMKRDFHKQLERSNASPFARRKTSLVRDILDESVNPDDLANAVFSKKYRASEVRDLKNFLHTGTASQKEAGKKAWNELKAETLESVKNAALGGAKNERGELTLTRARFKKAMSKVGMQKMKEIFSPQELQFFSNMDKTLELLEPVPGTAIGKGPTAQAVKTATDKIDKLLNAHPVLKAFGDYRVGAKALKAKPAEKFIPEPIIGATTKALGLGTGAAATDMEQR